MTRFYKCFLHRFYDVLLSVYLFNEERGFTSLDKLVKVFEEKYPKEEVILAAIKKHAQDERNHYRLFRDYFTRHGRVPFEISHHYGYCDQMVKQLFGRPISELDSGEMMRGDAAFFRLCRLIMIIEARGMKQVSQLLRNPLIHRNPALVKIFRVVERDEPSHTFPYRHWLQKHGKHLPSFRENLADLWVHFSLVCFKLPFLFANVFLRRRTDFAIAAPIVEAPPVERRLC